jgi:hypothetical protein
VLSPEDVATKEHFILKPTKKVNIEIGSGKASIEQVLANVSKCKKFSVVRSKGKKEPIQLFFSEDASLRDEVRAF